MIQVRHENWMCGCLKRRLLQTMQGLSLELEFVRANGPLFRSLGLCVCQAKTANSCLTVAEMASMSTL